MSNSSKVFLVVLLLMVGGGLYGFQKWNQANEPVAATPTGPVTVTIEQGMGGRDVAQLLEDSGVIRSASAFTAAATIDGRIGQIKAGTYQLDPSQSTEEILNVLVAGPPPPPSYRVTIPEGLTVAETLQRIADAEGSALTVEQLREGLALVALPAWVPVRELPQGAEAFEGLLFPETYEFFVEDTAADVLTRLVEETDNAVTEVGVPSRNGLDAYRTLVLASLIEREAQVPEERPIISSVIHNRLEVGMRLQIDATVVYGIGVATGTRPTSLLTADYEFDTPWSTYLYDGLPPTPISGVGRSSLQAAVSPADSNFFFYVAERDGSGRHRFAEDAEGHAANVADVQSGG